jgi:tRNA(Arg) A34 adenosine deaminase TadA
LKLYKYEVFTLYIPSKAVIENFLNHFYRSVELNPDEVPSFTQIFTSNLETLEYSINNVESSQFSSYHSELLCIQKAQEKLKNKYLDSCHLLTALEPCSMCTGAIIQSRIETVTYFAEQHKIPGISSFSLEFLAKSNHFPKIIYIPDNSVTLVFKEFFEKVRKKNYLP